jgi:hypothetical protein
VPGACGRGGGGRAAAGQRGHAQTRAVLSPRLASLYFMLVTHNHDMDARRPSDCDTTALASRHHRARGPLAGGRRRPGPRRPHEGAPRRVQSAGPNHTWSLREHWALHPRAGPTLWAGPGAAQELPRHPRLLLGLRGPAGREPQRAAGQALWREQTRAAPPLPLPAIPITERARQPLIGGAPAQARSSARGWPSSASAA